MRRIRSSWWSSRRSSALRSEAQFRAGYFERGEAVVEVVAVELGSLLQGLPDARLTLRLRAGAEVLRAFSQLERLDGWLRSYFPAHFLPHLPRPSRLEAPAPGRAARLAKRLQFYLNKLFSCADVREEENFRIFFVGEALPRPGWSLRASWGEVSSALRRAVDPQKAFAPTSPALARQYPGLQQLLDLRRKLLLCEDSLRSLLHALLRVCDAFAAADSAEEVFIGDFQGKDLFFTLRAFLLFSAELQQRQDTLASEVRESYALYLEVSLKGHDRGR